ncbi:uncharacterized protein LOC134069200 [Sardina pilchardus]|uniref:uncharacterized protein LOC134069200 n=1 Tax=Sardina pilchardus TaxID=27697 RepID=UPI002E11C162
MAQQKKNSFFSWTDDEVELLLRVTLDYKTQKALENIDWDSCVTKYGDILQRFITEYPFATARHDKDFPHKVEEITKAALTTKLKAIRSKYRLAVDSGRKSGHGRVVLLYFDACEKIWGGSPATTTLNSGVETSDLADQDIPDSVVNSSSPAESREDPEEEEGVSARRDRLTAYLSTHRYEKLKRKLPFEEQANAIAREELQLKRQVMQRMEETEKEFSDNMSRLTGSVERLTNSIAEGFAMMRQSMFQQPPSHYPLYHQMNSQPYGHPPPHTPNPTPNPSTSQHNSYSQYYEE